MALFSFDSKYYEKGILSFAGVDEAGRGPWAGPVVAAAVIFPPKISIKGLNDSKKLLPKKREELFEEIHRLAISVGSGIIGHEEIDSTNILLATFKAMKAAISALSVKPELVLVDGNAAIPGLGIIQECIISGDQKSAAIAAGSIIAKVTRDRIMEHVAKQFPQYGFERHKGYGTKEHFDALQQFGPCPIHRRSFHPVMKSAERNHE